jgi:hypothetical protein
LPTGAAARELDDACAADTSLDAVEAADPGDVLDGIDDKPLTMRESSASKVTAPHAAADPDTGDVAAKDIVETGDTADTADADVGCGDALADTVDDPDVNVLDDDDDDLLEDDAPPPRKPNPDPPRKRNTKCSVLPAKMRHSGAVGWLGS